MSEERARKDRELYHFHFSSEDVYESFCDSVETRIKQILHDVGEDILSRCPDAGEEIKNGVARLTEFYLEQSKEPLQKFEESVKDIFALPTNVILPGYTEDKVVTPEEVARLEEEAEDFDQELLKAVQHRVRLKAEIRKFEQVEPIYNKTNEILQFYKDRKSKSGDKTISELMEVLEHCVACYYQKKLDRDKSKPVEDIFGHFNVE